MKSKVLLFAGGFFTCAFITFLYVSLLARSPVLLVPNAQAFSCFKAQSMLLSDAGLWRIERFDEAAIVIRSYGLRRILRPNGFKIILDRKIFSVPNDYQVGSPIELSRISSSPDGVLCKAGHADMPNITF